MNDVTPKLATQLSLFDLWESDTLCLSQRQKQLVPKLKDWLSQQSSPIARALLGHENRCYWTAEDMRMLERSACAHFGVVQDVAEILRVLVKVVARLNEFQRDPLPWPSIPVYTPPTPSYFHKDLPGALRRVKAWREAQDRMLKEETARNEGNQKISIEHVLVSAALHGGLLDANSIVALARVLAGSPPSLRLLGDRVYSDLSLPWQGIPDSQLRGWTADALTAALLIRLPENPAPWVLEPGTTDRDIKRKLGQKIRHLFRSAGVAREHCPSSLQRFLDDIALASRTELPPVLVSYASRRIISHSVRPDVLLRILGQSPCAPGVPAKEPARRADADAEVLGYDLLDRTDYEPRWLRDMRDLLAMRNRQGARKSLVAAPQEMQAKYPPVAARMIEFANYLSAGSSLKRALADSTVQQYAIAVAKRLGCLLDGEDPASFSVETLESLYVQVLENTDHSDAPRGLRSRVARALRWFHDFLAHRYHIGELSEPSLLGADRGLVSVDASIITLEEYYTILADIQRLSLHRDIKRIATLIVILGFRCGLRHMEALKLGIADVRLKGSALLLIRPWECRKLKTKAARRNLPLEALLTPDELDLLRQWKADRLRTWQSTDSPFLFSVPEISPDLVPARAIFANIHQVMRSVTGDQTLRYHHLRHSFATWSFLRLMLSDLDEPNDLFPHLPQTTSWLRDSKEFRTNLYGHDFPTRKHVYAIASLLGHSGPDISVEHYIHSFDWVLSMSLNCTKNAPVRRQVVLASGRPASTVYSWLESNCLPEATRRLFQSRYPESVQVIPRAQIALDSKASGNNADADDHWLYAVWEFLHSHSCTGTPLHELSREFDLERMERMLARAETLRDLPSGGKGAYRHRMKVWIRDRRDPNKNVRLCCPNELELQTDKDVVRLLAPRMKQLLEADPAGCRKVLDWYVHHIWLEKNYLVFSDPSDPNDAQEYLKFLVALGIKRRNIRFISFDVSERSVWRKKWRDSLGLNRRNVIEIRKPQNQRSVAATRAIGIEPIFNLDARRQQNRTAQPNSSADLDQPNNSTGACGFRFLMVMADIYLAGIEDPGSHVSAA